MMTKTPESQYLQDAPLLLHIELTALAQVYNLYLFPSLSFFMFAYLRTLFERTKNNHFFLSFRNNFNFNHLKYKSK